MSSQQGRERQDKEDNNKQNNVSNYLLIDYLIGVLTPLAKLVVCSDGYLLCCKAFGLFKPVARRLKHTASKRSRELWNQRQIKATVIDGEHCNEWMHLLVRNASLSFQVIIFAAKLLILIMTLFTFDKRVGLNSLA